MGIRYSYMVEHWDSVVSTIPLTKHHHIVYSSNCNRRSCNLSSVYKEVLNVYATARNDGEVRKGGFVLEAQGKIEMRAALQCTLDFHPPATAVSDQRARTTGTR